MTIECSLSNLLLCDNNKNNNLGSGRPFVLEIRDCFHPPSPALLQEIVHHINAGEGINDQLDVSVAYLRVVR